jgi:hypothetical protein
MSEDPRFSLGAQGSLSLTVQGAGAIQEAPIMPLSAAAQPTLDAETGPIRHVLETPEFDFATMLRRVSEAGGKSYFAQVREIYALKYGPGRLTPFEYYFHRLFDDELTLRQKGAFVGASLRAEVSRNPLNEAAFRADKLAFYARAHTLGLPTPATLAVCHAERDLPGAVSLRTPADLAAWLRGPAAYPLFAKPNGLTAGLGSASVSRYLAKTDELEMGDGRRFPVGRFVGEVERYFPDGYLIQARHEPHVAIRSLSGSVLSTVRMMVLDSGEGPRLIRATWRAPVSDPGAGGVWRGHMMADVDPVAGVAVRAIRGHGPDQELVDVHPDTGRPIKGAQLPCWDEACALALQAAKAFPKLPLTGWRIAITDHGPIIVDLEPDGGDPAVTQAASGRGLLSGPYGDFVRARGHASRKRS